MANDPENSARRRALERIRHVRSHTAVDAGDWARAIQGGDRTALARAISLVESQRPEDRPRAQALLEALPAPPADTRRYGLTGVPGVGKSTWIEQAGLALIRDGFRVAVLAVDPSSQRTGGSMLGDKTRMEELSRHPQAYVRPSPTGETLGGVARATGEAIRLCEAAGYNRIFIETVGVGQSETEVRQWSDVFVLLMLPGGGDGVQGIKRGILEWADALIMNKADGDGVHRAESGLSAYRGALSLLSPPLDGAPPLLGTSTALDPENIAHWVHRIEERLDAACTSGQFQSRRERQRQVSMSDLLQREALLKVQSHPAFAQEWQRLQKEAAQSQTLPYDSIRRLLDRLH